MVGCFEKSKSVDMSKMLERFKVEHKQRIEQFFASKASCLSENSRQEFLKFKEQTIFTVEQILRNERSYVQLNPDGYEGQKTFSSMWSAFTAFENQVIAIDNAILIGLGEIEKVVIESRLHLHHDPELLSHIEKYAFSLVENFRKYKIPGYFAGDGYNAFIHSNTYTFFSRFATYQTTPSIKNDLESLKKKVILVISDAQKIVKKQEDFIRSRVQQLDEQTLGTSLPLHETIVTTTPNLPSYSSNDIALIQTLRNQREQLLRTLQNP